MCIQCVWMQRHFTCWESSMKIQLSMAVTWLQALFQGFNTNRMSTYCSMNMKSTSVTRRMTVTANLVNIPPIPLPVQFDFTYDSYLHGISAWTKLQFQFLQQLSVRHPKWKTIGWSVINFWYDITYYQQESNQYFHVLNYIYVYVSHESHYACLN